MSFFDTVEDRFVGSAKQHPKMLYSLMRMFGVELAVEVGTSRGQSACWMARAIQEQNNGRLYCIDDFDDNADKHAERNWNDNLCACGVRDWVVLLKGKSREVQWPHKIDFAFIDGWKSYMAVIHDFLAAECRNAACIVLADTVRTIGPRRVVELIRRHRSHVWGVTEITDGTGLAICTRKAAKPLPTFSQELPWGVDLADAGEDGIKAHLEQAAAETLLDYRRFPL